VDKYKVNKSEMLTPWSNIGGLAVYRTQTILNYFEQINQINV